MPFGGGEGRVAALADGATKSEVKTRARRSVFFLFSARFLQGTQSCCARSPILVAPVYLIDGIYYFAASAFDGQVGRVVAVELLQKSNDDIKYVNRNG